MMKNLSYVILDGNLTADPEIKNTHAGKKVSQFSVAVNHSYSKEDGEDDVSFFEIETWDKMAENCQEYLKKGSRVTVMGNLKQDRWKNQDGAGRSKIKIVATNVRFDSSPKSSEKKAA